jgi:hypothetical protein
MQIVTVKGNLEYANQDIKADSPKIKYSNNYLEENPMLGGNSYLITSSYLS